MIGTIPILEGLGGVKTHGGGEKKSSLVPRTLAGAGLMAIATSCAPTPDQTPIAPPTALVEYNSTQLDAFLKAELAPQLAASTKTFIETVSSRLPSDIDINRIHSFNFQSGIIQENEHLTVKPLSINYETGIKNQDNSVGNYKVEHKPFNILMNDGSQKLLVCSTYTDENGKINTVVREVMLLQDGSDLIIAIKSDETESRIGLYGFEGVLNNEGKIVKGGSVFGFDYIKGIKNTQATFLNKPGLIGVADVKTTLKGTINSTGIPTPDAQKNFDLYQGQSVDISFNPSGSPTPSVPMIEVGELQIPDPKASNPEFFDLENPDSPVVQFANAFGVKPEEVGELTPIVKTDVDRKQFIVLTTGDLIATADFDESGTPLIIAEQGESGEWGWRNAPLDKLAKISGFDHFGVLVDPNNKLSGSVEKTEFNSAAITFAWSDHIKTPDRIDFSWIDKQAKFAKENSMDMRLYHLIFPSQMPNWLIDGVNSGQIDKDQAIEILKNNLTQIINYCKQLGIKEYSVVNEPYISPYRTNDPLYKAIGEDYIDIAFETAREADPSAILIYNDTFNHATSGQNGIMTKRTQQIVERLKSKGLVDKVGLQMHIDGADLPKKEDMIKVIQSYGLPVSITEMDVDMSKVSGTNEERMIKQADIFRLIAEAAIESGVVDDITVWGVGDQFSWIEKNGNPDANPTLFNDQMNPKPAYFALLQSFLNADK